MDRANIVHVQFELPTFKIFGSLLLPLCLLLLKFVGIKCVVTIHGPVLPPGKKAQRIIKQLLPENYKWVPANVVKLGLQFLYFFIERAGARIIVHSHIFKEWLLSQGLTNVSVIYHGVNPPKIHNIPLETRRSLIICFGTISPRRGIEKFIMAVSEIRDYLVSRKFNVIIAGHLPCYYIEYARSLRNRINEMGLNELVGMEYNVNEERLEYLFNNAYLAVLPYEFSESASGVLPMAFEYGVPVLVADTEYFREVLGSEFAGMFKTGNHKSLADKLFTILSDEKIRERILEQMVSKLSPYGWDIIASETIKLYMDTLRES